MTNQPDRPDGDGLSREQITEYIRELNTIAAECEIAGTAELSRAAHNLYRIAKQWFKSLPARDAAEGAGVSDEDWNRALDCAMSCVRPEFTKASDISRAEMDNAMQHAFGILSLRKITAPPKPAPDAMRNALQDALGEIVLVIAFLERDGGTDRLPATIKSLVARLVKADRAIRDTLSAPAPPAQEIESESMFHDRISNEAAALRHAPVPPADGAPIINIVRALGPPDPSDEEFEHGWAACNEAVVELLTDLGFPPCAGAAEPVAWRRVRNDGTVTYWRTAVPDSTPLYAAPPVRRDREAIAQCLMNCAQIIDVVRAEWKGEGTWSEWDQSVRDDITKQLAKLSFPVQPGAGERET